MIRRIAAVTAAASLLPPLLLAASASAAAPSTTLSGTLMNASGSAPMARAHVLVFFVRPASRLHAKTSLPRIGSGTASSSGSVSFALRTSAVPAAALGDVGSGNDAFNALILAWDSARQYNVTQAVIQEGHTFSYDTRAGTNPATGRPALISTAQVKGLDKYFSTPNAPAYQTPKGHKYRYTPITPLNSAPGLHAQLAYTYSASTARQSEFELPTTQYGGVSLTGNQEEENDRTVHTGIHQNGSYHRWVWADYYFVYYLVTVSSKPPMGWYQWEPDHFQGSVTDNNPDHATKTSKKPVGHLAFKQPRFNRGPQGGWRVEIKSDSLPFERDNGTRQENAVGINFTLGTLPGGISGGGIKLQDLMTYGSITAVTWTYRKGCPRRHTRVVYAYHTDPVEAGRVLAACEPDNKV